MSQETLYALAETVSAHLSNLGDVLHGIVPSVTGPDEVVDGAQGKETSSSSSMSSSEVTLKAHLQTLQYIEQKIRRASEVLPPQ